MTTTQLLPTTKAAEMIGVQPQTLRLWRCRGQGPRYVRLSGPLGRVAYSLEHLEEWLRERTFSSVSEERAARTHEAA